MKLFTVKKQSGDTKQKKKKSLYCKKGKKKREVPLGTSNMISSALHLM